MKFSKWIILAALSMGLNNVVLADDMDNGGKACPAELAGAYDEAYGDGTAAATRCMQKSGKAKIVIQINQSCRDTAIVSDGAGGWKHKNHPTSCNDDRAYALGNMRNMIKDYNAQGINYDIVAVVHSGGVYQLIDGNKFGGQVQDLMDQGVRFYACLNTIKKFVATGKLDDPDVVGGTVSDQLVPGVEFVSAGITAIPDFQSKGYKYAQP